MEILTLDKEQLMLEKELLQVNQSLVHSRLDLS